MKTMDFLTKANEITFMVQNEIHKVNVADITPETSLNSYLRQTVHLKGTKNMCFEGGCGVCIVTVITKDPVTGNDIHFAVNSCLVSIFTCHGWRIFTVEGIGNPINGYHKVQKVLADFNGTQCGFCSPGMVMNMYALSENGKLTMKEVENSFGGNICRCTGYRPILAAFKSLCTDADPKLLGTYPDIEDIKICPKTNKQCENKCLEIPAVPVYFDLKDSKWIKVFTIDDLLNVLKQNPTSSYMLVGGNTARGVYRGGATPDIYIDVFEVKDLKNSQIQGNNLIIGADMSLESAMELFYKTAEQNKAFSYLKKLADHIDLIANVPVRNIGTLAGNLMIKHEHHDFPSDVFLIFEAAGATLTIVDVDKKEVVKTPLDFVSFDMKQKVIKNIILPARDDTYKYESYKIMPRAQNAHAHVNAAFLLKFKDQNTIESAKIVYGCINPSFVHATNAENYLAGKNLFDNAVLQGVFNALNQEIKPDRVLPEPSEEFRKQLAISLFYKFVLSITPDGVISPRNKSGGQKLERPVSSGVQDFETKESLYPLTQPIPKVEALAQTSGQAQYIFDMPDIPNQLYASFVLAQAPANSVISKIDPSEALKIEDVVAFYTKDDVPGKNTFTPNEGSMMQIEEELFCSGTVQYYFQPVGLIVANSQSAAMQASNLVKITYTPSKDKPLLTIREILKANATHKIIKDTTIEPKTKGTDVKHVVKGSFDIGWQYHYHMETQICNVIPTEDGLDMYPSTQWMDLTQNAASAALNIPANKINVFVRRLGGAYGAKISRNSLISTAAAVAAYKLNKPVKLQMPFVANMNVVGKRYPCSCDYEIGVNDKGVVQYMETKLYSDYGMGGNEGVIFAIIDLFTKHYNTETWKVECFSTRSDNHAGTWCRAPGSTEGLAMIESIMEHIAYNINVDPLELRLANIDKNDTKLAGFIDELKKWADIDNRKQSVATFNKDNRWVKKGLAVIPMIYGFTLFGNWTTIISIYNKDGTVALAHGGIEMGQGINTKAIQVCAYKFGIPIEKVSVKPSNNLISPNSMASGGSITSEAVCYGVKQACETLLKRMEPYKENNQTWEQLVSKCYQNSVDLTATAMYSAKAPDLKNYDIYGVCATEVIVDILTGNHHITRVDLLEDTGDSMSPMIDIGQVEGAYVMGQGYYTTEQIVFDENGQLLTNRTWNYKPPGAKDIPIDFRVKFPKDNPNPVGVLNSKATAEPPLCLTCSLPIAIRNAIASAREEADKTKEKWYPFDGPTSVENTFLNSLHDVKQYVL